jgi:hypothetical protein
MLDWRDNFIRLFAEAFTPRIMSSTNAVKEMRQQKNALNLENYPQQGVEGFVSTYYRPENYEWLAGQENVYLLQPSTSGRNKIPYYFAWRLRNDFGGEIVDFVCFGPCKNRGKTQRLYG